MTIYTPHVEVDRGLGAGFVPACAGPGAATPQEALSSAISEAMYYLAIGYVPRLLVERCCDTCGGTGAARSAATGRPVRCPECKGRDSRSVVIPPTTMVPPHSPTLLRGRQQDADLVTDDDHADMVGAYAARRRAAIGGAA